MDPINRATGSESSSEEAAQNTNLQIPMGKRKKMPTDAPGETPPASEEATGKRVQFLKKDWNLMVTWLEMPRHKASVVGADGKTAVGAKYTSKITAFGHMATYINTEQKVGTTLAPIKAQGAKNRFNNFYGKYRQVAKAKEETGFGVTPEDIANGITTLEDKLEAMCPFFARMDALFGAHPAMAPAENLFVSSLGQDEDGGMDNDLLTMLDTPQEGIEISPASEVDGEDSDDECPTGDADSRAAPQANVRSDSPLVRPPDIGQTGEDAHPCNTPLSPSDSPTDMDEEDITIEFDSATRTDGQKKTGAKGKKKQPTKKKKFMAGGVAANSFSQPLKESLESLSQNKLLSSEFKQKALDEKMKFAERVAKRQETLENSRLEIEKAKLEHEKEMLRARVQSEKELAEAKIKGKNQVGQLNARAQIINANSHLSDAEIHRLLAFLD